MPHPSAESAAAEIGFLHPGVMGVSVAASLKASGAVVSWCSAGRSAETRARADEHGLVDRGTLDALCARCGILFSICPPHGAEQLAQDVAAAGFKGIFVDANAISPHRMARIAAGLEAAGVRVVDGGIVGPPAWKPDDTLMVLSGAAAEAVAARFTAGPLVVRAIGAEVGQASVLKMCFAARTKGLTALVAAVLATAEHYGVRDQLPLLWEARGKPSALDEWDRQVRVGAGKAWRFAGEMDEIAETLGAAGQPEGFHRAAADLYRRLDRFKNQADAITLDDVLADLLSAT